MEKKFKIVYELEKYDEFTNGSWVIDKFDNAEDAIKATVSKVLSRVEGVPRDERHESIFLNVLKVRDYVDGTADEDDDEDEWEQIDSYCALDLQACRYGDYTYKEDWIAFENHYKSHFDSSYFEDDIRDIVEEIEDKKEEIKDKKEEINKLDENDEDYDIDYDELWNELIDLENELDELNEQIETIKNNKHDLEADLREFVQGVNEQLEEAKVEH